MADVYYVKSTGSNTAPYDTWAKAATSIATVFTQILSDTDSDAKVFVDSAYNPGHVGMTISTYNGVQVYSVSDTNEPPTTYAKGATIDMSATSGADLVIRGGTWHGFIFKSGTGTGICDITLNDSNGNSGSFYNCDFYTGGTSSSTRINIGNQSASAGKMYTRTVNCNFYWNNANHGFFVHQFWDDDGSDFCAGATVPLTLFRTNGGFIRINGADLSDISGTLVVGAAAAVSRTEIWGSKIHASVTPLGTSVTPNGEVFLFDCSDGDTHYNFRHEAFNGSTTVSTSIYVNTADGAKYDGTNAHSLVVDANSNSTLANPYYSPWIDVYHDGTSAITPYFEILRDGSSAAYTDTEVWGEFLAKTTSGSSRATYYSDRNTAAWTAGSAQADGGGVSVWTGENATAKSQKVDSGSSLTPAEIGHIRGRIGVAGDLTVYLNPKILGV